MVEAYGSTEASEVEVAKNAEAVGVEVEMALPEESVARSWSAPRLVEPVPPLATESTVPSESEPAYRLPVLLAALKVGDVEAVRMPVVELYVSSPFADESEVLEILLSNVLQSVEVRRPVIEAVAFWNKEEVASAVGTAEAPVMLPRTELAAMAARPIEALLPPIW